MVEVKGHLEKFQKGFGFLRDVNKNFEAIDGDTYVPPAVIKKFSLDEGVFIEGTAEEATGKNKNPVLSEIKLINNHTLEDVHKIKSFKQATSINPSDKFNLTINDRDISGKCMDLLIPMGRGQRGLVISPPKAGKTTILQNIAKAITQNHAGTEIFILLVDERPEEVTDFQRSVPNAHVVYSSSDQSTESHIRITQMVMNSAIRSMEAGNDVVVLIDSLTRMGRAYNKKSNSGGRTLSGGLSANALEFPRRFFGAARNIEDGGSLSIIATILVDTGSRMDEVIFQEFKGTGNMDMVLSRICAEQRVWPAINLRESGTRKEHLILTEADYAKSVKVRNMIGGMDEVEGMKYFYNLIKDKRI